MGYKTEINYILKASSSEDGTNLHSAKEGDLVKVTKSGERTFVLSSPIMFADHNWNILGMCEIKKATVDKEKTILEAKVLTLFTKDESVIVSKLIQDAELRKGL